jgi:protein-S-isoprenylcysteine O-methyltransferase Ste14
MDFLGYLTIALFATWCVSEVVISLVSFRNRSRASAKGRDRFSFVVMWLSIMPPIWFALLVRLHKIFASGSGSFSTLSPLLGYLGCLFIVLGIAIRLVAVATLKKQFTDRVSIVEKHEIVDTGIYRTVRHPAYLGNLASLLGLGLASGNWFSLSALVVLPIAATWYRIGVEERALLGHFGLAYQEYASRTKRLLPRIY